MSIPKFKRKPTGLEYVDNAYELQKEIMNLVSKLSARWARIYQQPIDRLACIQANLVNMAYSINPTTPEDFITKRWLLKMARATLQALEKRIMDMTNVLYLNPFKCFIRKNGKNYTFNEATMRLDKKLETPGVMYGRQYDLINGVINADKKKYNKIKIDDIKDSEIKNILVSKLVQITFE